MKVLYVTSFFPPDHAGGTENYTRVIASKLVQRGDQVQVLCAGCWDEGSQYFNGFSDDVYEGVPVRRIDLNWRLAPDPNRSLYVNPVVASFVREYVGEIHPDIVHVTSCRTLSSSVLGVVHEAGFPLVLTLTDLWFLCPRLTLLRSDSELCNGQTTPWDCLKCMLQGAKSYRWPIQFLPERAVEQILTLCSKQPQINRRASMIGMALDMEERKRSLLAALDLPDAVISPSHFLASVFASVGVTRSLHIQNHGHDLSWLDGLRRVPADGQLRIGYIGHLQEIKGVDILLRAFLRSEAPPHVTLQIWGSLTPPSHYIRQIQNLAAMSDQVYLRGAYAHNELAEVLSALDIIVMPSMCYENSPLVIHEAFAAGVPVIATDLGGMRELVHHEVNGLLFDRANEESLAAQLLRVIENPELLAELRGGIPPVKSVEQEAEELLELYETIIANKAKENAA